MTLLKKYLILKAISSALLPLIFIFPQTTLADDDSDSFVTNLHTKQIFIANNSQNYTQSNSPIALSLSADAVIKADAGNVGRIKSWSLWLNMHGRTAPHHDTYFYRSFTDHKVSKSYAFGNRPKTVHRTETLSIPESSYENLFVSHCNQLANQLRTQGLSNQQIFAEDRIISYRISAAEEVNFTWGIIGGGFDSAGSSTSGQTLNVICQKWQAPTHATGQGGLSIAEPIHEVTNATINQITEQTTLAGHCAVSLTSSIESLQPNTPVEFRYKHIDGHTGLSKLSQVYQVTTGSNKLATFSHQFDIPNKADKDEHGTLEIVGLTPEFKSKRKLYEVQCSEAAPSGITTDLGPTASMYYLIQERAQVGNQFCPVKVRLVGTIKTRGARQGKAIFVGDSYLSPTFNFDLTANAQQQFITDRVINWDLDSGTPQAASHFAHGNTGGQAFRFKDIRVRFNVSTRLADPETSPNSIGQLATPTADPEYRLAAQSEQHQFRLECEELAQPQQGLSLSGKTPSTKDQQHHAIPLENATISSIKQEQLNKHTPSGSKALKAKPEVKSTLLLPAVQAAKESRNPNSTSSIGFQSNVKADIRVKALNIAGQKVGGTLHAKDAIRYENGHCLFDLTYSIENKGQVTSTPFNYRLLNNGKLINLHQNIILQANAFDSFYKTVHLRPGINTVTLTTDSENSVNELNESNNQLVKRYNVMGRCQSETKPALKSLNNSANSNKKGPQHKLILPPQPSR